MADSICGSHGAMHAHDTQWTGTPESMGNWNDQAGHRMARMIAPQN